MDFSLDIKRIFPPGGPARYNVAAWQKSNQDTVVLVAREVNEPGGEASPDMGRLVLFEIDQENRITHERIIWEPLHRSFFLEDPRARVGSSGDITIGLTAVLRAENGYLPFPAIVQIQSEGKWAGKLPPVTLIHGFGPGKNITPVSKNIFMFRPENPEYHHKLLVFNPYNSDPDSAYDIEFPKNLEWALWRIGTTMPPIWIDNKNALLIMHGVTIENGKYIYSIGRARMRKSKGKKFEVTVHPSPIITPEMFIRQGKPLEEELHPELRKVVYACGGVIKRKEKENLNLYVNVADRSTYEVKIPLNQLQKDLFT